MTKSVLEKYKIVPCREPPPPSAEEPAEGAQNLTNLSTSLGTEDARKTCEFFKTQGEFLDNSNCCFLVSLERDRTSMLAPQNVRLQMFHNSQRGKKDDINFTLEVNIT